MGFHDQLRRSWDVSNSALCVGLDPDPARFPELERDLGLRPWTVARLYQSARFDTAGAGLVLEVGTLSPALLGRTGQAPYPQKAVAHARGFELHDHALALYAVCTKRNCEHKSK
mgnify:CR=1 FL=1